jgi:hypothetical protein
MPDTTPFPSAHNRRDPWQDRGNACVEYQLRTDAEADVMCRLLGLFAQLQLLPEALHMERLQDDLHISLRLPGISLHRAGVLAQKLRGLVCVWEVSWQHLDHSLVTEVA